MATRKYEQRLRAESAERTRRRILDAVISCLEERPAEAVSIERVAGLARVARPTVYQVFGSRAGLFDALGADLLHRGGFEGMLRDAEHPDARQGLRGAIRGVVGIYVGQRDLLRALSSMARLDAAAVGGAVERMERGRLSGMSELADRLAEQGALRADVSAQRASDLLWLLTSFDGVDLLLTGRSRSAEEVADTLVATAERTLLR
ncbi:TetR/AcrR family transcriptional regulator [Streptomonospora wellingtoniae]|uniref:TetR/AcrR family transcriptional regulator n=1 Tax=Streptomonospora wellingtoniae TaxID=3075544 RepID=A0ABU2KX22_9ACTN|nr:TetR/AcrR family transcriptional regulator [Streptomonospora sp. DSM 45055]MDT0303856.1 TetR/AcrR family transcriptional regulator [Streptomonospora sp. DSM 45055]